MKLIKFTLPLALIFLSGCGKDTAEIERLRNEVAELKKEKEVPAQINGSIFIVTKGGENFKLGRVPVSLIDQSKWNQHVTTVLKKRGDQLDEIIRKKKEVLIQYEACVDQLKSIVVEASARFDPYTKLFLSLTKNPNYVFSLVDEAGQRIFVIERKYGFDGAEFRRTTSSLVDMYKVIQAARVRVLAEVKNIHANCDRLDEEFIRLNSLCDTIYLDCADDVFNSTAIDDVIAKTDANGLFNVSSPKDGDYVICAHSTRNVGGSEEKYYWASPISITANSRNSKITLSNDNVMSSLAPLNNESDVSGPDLNQFPEKGLIKFFDLLPTDYKIYEDER